MTRAMATNAPGPTGMARIVEAERDWAARVAAVRQEIAAAVEQARVGAAAAEADAERALPALIAARRAELEREIETAAREAEAALEAQTAIFAEAPDATVKRLADAIVGSIPWFASVPPRSSDR